MINQVQKLLKRIYQQPGFSATIAPDFFPSSISSEEGLFLQNFLTKNRPQVLIECGFGYGATSLWFLSSPHRPKQHLIVDPFRLKTKGDKIYQLVKKFPQVKFEEKQTSQQFLANFAKQKSGKQKSSRQVDLIFLDADQMFDAFVSDIHLASRVLKIGGFIIVRNTWNPGIRKGIMFFFKNLDLDLPQFSPLEKTLMRQLPWFGELWLRWKRKFNGDFCVLQLTKPDHRPWNHFIHF